MEYIGINKSKDKENTACVEPLAKAQADVALIQSKVLYFLTGKKEATDISASLCLINGDLIQAGF